MSINTLFTPSRGAGDVINIRISDDVILTLSWCPPGSFYMGSSDDDKPVAKNEIPRHQVTITKGFWMGCTPIIQEEWQQIVNQKPRFFDDETNMPVEGVTWTEANEFCGKLTAILRKRSALRANQVIALPTEAQWEYACRAGTASPRFFTETKLEDYCWYRENSDDKRHTVALKKSNPWGLYDVYGNVFEWCQDDYYSYIAADLLDPCFVHIDPLLKIVRGGAYISRKEECRSASRETIDMSNPNNEPTGFRVVCQEL